jgi:uncharacterized membrane protein (DUF106 family)
MTAMQSLFETLIHLLDYPLGWLLYLPRDLALVLLALATAGLLALGRARFTNQDLLRRCRQDLLRLKVLRTDAKRQGDRVALQRMQTTKSMIQLILLRADVKLMAILFIPLALLALWSAERLDFFPIYTGQDVTVRASFPPSSVDKLAVLIPCGREMTLKTSPIQVIEAAGEGDPQGVATWVVQFSAKTRQLDLEIRHQDETAIHPVAVNTAFYLPPVQRHPESRITATEVQMVRYRSLGIIPGIESLGLAPWMIGYLLLSLLLIPVTRRVVGAA